MKRSRIKPTNKRRRIKDFVRFFGSIERVEWIKSRPCDTCGAWGPCQNSHMLTRGSRNAKPENILSQCNACHRAVERGIHTFAAGIEHPLVEGRYGLRLDFRATGRGLTLDDLLAMGLAVDAEWRDR